MGMITSIFNNLKELPVKFCNILSIDETFDSETQLFGMHVSIHIKLFDTDF
jgi:hypothetical protein